MLRLFMAEECCNKHNYRGQETSQDCVTLNSDSKQINKILFIEGKNGNNTGHERYGLCCKKNEWNNEQIFLKKKFICCRLMVVLNTLGRMVEEGVRGTTSFVQDF